MRKLQMLRALVNQRLSAAVEEIFVMFERTIAEYEEELSRTKEEKERQHQLLDAVFKTHQVELHRTGVQQPPHIKEEEEEVWITQEEECLLGQEEADPTKFPLTVVSVKTEEHEDKPPESSQLHHSPNMCEGHLPEQQEWSLRMVKVEPQPSHIKEEEEEHSISSEGEHLEGLEEVDVTKMPVTGVIVRSKYDKLKGESEEKREAEPPSSSSTQHMTTEADGDHCGGSQADKLLAPLSDSEDTTSHSPDTDDEHSKDDKTCHTDNTHLTCSHCDKTFRYPCYLKVHMRIHTGDKHFRCSVCGNGFAQKNALKDHMRTHTGEKPCSCSICGKGFVHSNYLKVHMRTHTGDKSFICSICGKGFVESTNLKVHMRTHTGEKPFKCSICSKGFVQSQYLKVHMRTHTGEKPFTCSICGKCFVGSHSLKAHLRTHTGEKPFSCSICGKGLKSGQNLKVHMRTHTGEKPYLCLSCDKSFCHHTAFVRHMSTHAGD
ncbi:zinc finger protein 391-like isoform X1 [Entelurus aequoreus]|uniref:zinc finger protein 391-like isoform X1 n=1 Tax=Entelurus aequoreus TaxID=161455 RepID=UPI002B1E2F38|nr:zinc finger protein 391-like isoform X1 [Entelurus aequoreus]